MRKTDKALLYGVACVLAAGGLCVGCLVAVVFLPFSWFSHGGAAETAKHFIKNDPAVHARIGEIKSFGFFPSGSVREVNGAGEAHLIFSIRGAKADGRATVNLSKKPGEDWKVTAAELVVDGRVYILRGKGSNATPGGPGPEVGYPKDKGRGLAA